MLKLLVPGQELYNEATEEFIVTKDCTLLLEHSLLSVVKWESKWKVPFLENKPPKTYEQSVDYIRCMTINTNVSPDVYFNITPNLIAKVNEYIADNHSATFITRRQKARPPVKEPVTSELIYYWMISYNIPFEAQKWHLGRLLMLIDVCGFKNTPPQKMSKNDLMKRNNALNKQRLAKNHGKG